MGDFPSQLIAPPGGVIHTGSPASLCSDGALIANGAFAAAATWAAGNANLAMFFPFLVEVTVTAYQMGFEVGVQSGNYDVGIYDELGNRLVSKGSTTVPAAGIAIVDITDTVLTPGLYYMAMNVDVGTVATFTRNNSAAALQLLTYGVRQQAVGAVTLPNPATFSNVTVVYLPSLSVALKSTI